MMDYLETPRRVDQSRWWTRIVVVLLLLQFLFTAVLFLGSVWGGADFYLTGAWCFLATVLYLRAMHRLSKEVEWQEIQSVKR
jgi:hypothetical protein